MVSKLLHPDETKRPDLQWCPNCGYNADVVTWESRIGTRYRCRFCGLVGRFGDGVSAPIKCQPGFEEDKPRYESCCLDCTGSLTGTCDHHTPWDED